MKLAGFPESRLADLRAEWAWESLTLEKERDVPVFSDWVRQRIAQPFRITPRTLSRAGQHHGPDFILSSAYGLWPEAIEAATETRSSHDDFLCCLAHAWLRAAKSDSGKHFLRFMQHVSSRTGNHDIPLWESHARAAYATKIEAEGASRLVMMAKAIRDIAARENQETQIRVLAEEIRSQSPHLRITVLSEAARLEMCSDEILNAYASLLKSCTAYNSGEPWHYHLSRHLRHAVGSAIPLSDEDARTRKKIVENLGERWLRHIPADWENMLDGRAMSPGMARRWVLEVSSGERRPPLDTLLDYGLWLAERR